MRKLLLAAVSVVAVSLAHGFNSENAAAAQPAPQQAPEQPVDQVKTIIRLSGFDSRGEPEIRVMRDGSMYVVFNFMPPSDFADSGELGPFEHFDRQMEKAIGVPVLWDDREFFLIKKPRPDTIDRIRQFVEKYRSRMRLHR